MLIQDLNPAAFGSIAVHALAKVMTAVGGWDRSNSLDTISVWVKTARAWSGGDECDGTEFPTDAQMEVAHQVAREHGLKVWFEPCEKGWGDLYFGSCP